MSYYFDKSVSKVCVKTDVAFYSENVKVKEILMPESLDADRITFSSAGMISLAEYISYATEKEILYFIYYLLKASSEWNEKTINELNLIIDSDAIFYNKKRNMFCFATEKNAEDVNLIEFMKKTIFDAVYKEKELQTLVELISFIRASIHTTPRDVLLFIEMSKYGRTFMADWSKIKKSFDNTQTRNEIHTGSLKTKNKTINSVNNSTDFSSFLSDEDLFSDSEISEEISNVGENKMFSGKTQEEACDVISAQMTSNEEVGYSDFSKEPIKFKNNKTEIGAKDEPGSEVNSFNNDSFASIDYRHENEKDSRLLLEELFSSQNSNYESEEDSDNNAVEPAEEDNYPLGFEKVTDTEPDNLDVTIVLQDTELHTQRKKAFLIDVNGNETPVDKDYFVIGRNSKESDFSVRDSSISRRHVAIISTDEGFYIEDLGSLNKTFLNGKQLMPNHKELLSDGDVVLVSRNEFKFSTQTIIEKR